MARHQKTPALCNSELSSIRQTPLLAADMTVVPRCTALLSPAHIFSAVLLLSALFGTAAQDSSSPFNCQPTLDGTQYNLTSLKGVQVVTRERDSPPSKFIDELRFDLCAKLEPVVGRLSEDQVCARRCFLHDKVTNLGGHSVRLIQLPVSRKRIGRAARTPTV